MNTVQPIRSIQKIQQIKSNLSSKPNLRDYILFTLGIHSGLRISDILHLKVKHVLNNTHFNLREQKTNKYQRIKIQPQLKQDLLSYIKANNLQPEDYLIYSQKYTPYVTASKKETITTPDGKTKTKSIKHKIKNEASNSPINRQHAWRVINKACNDVGIKGEVGCHTLRKTFGFHFFQYYSQGGNGYNGNNNNADNGNGNGNGNNNNYNSSRALAILQQIFNHSSTHTTLRYIGIAQDEVDEMVSDFNFDI